MKTGFKNNLDPKEQKKAKSPWDFKAPEYHDRTGRGVDAGCTYGVGHKNPVGHSGKTKSSVDTLPMGRVSTMRDV